MKTNVEGYAPRRSAAVFGCLWLLVFSFALPLMAAGCGNDDMKLSASSSTGIQGQGGAAAGSTAPGTGGSDKSGSIGGSSSGIRGSGENPTGTDSESGANRAQGGTGGAIESSQGGASQASGASGSAGQGSSAGAGGPRCRTKGSQIALFGDSYISWITHTFPDDFDAVVGDEVRNYAIGGYAMASGGMFLGGGLIPDQFDQASADDPDILAAVMDGGGNDILLPDLSQFPDGDQCANDPNSASIPDCQAITKLAVDNALECIDKAVNAGVRDVIYFFYPHVPQTWLAASPNEILDYAKPLARDACESAFTRSQGKLTCRFVDLNPVFEGHPEYFSENDLHPSPQGSAAMAQAIWKVMVDNCIAQPESSGCCTP